MKKSSLIVALICFLGSAVLAQEGNWINLFDGKSLDGWSVHSGFAKYRVEDGAIVGTAVKKSPNTFLCTEKTYADFVLEFEVKVDSKLNSGVQFRSEIAKEDLTLWLTNEKGESYPHRIPKDRVYGYQVEIAANGGAGGIYDEARRAMIRPWWIEDESKESKAFKDGEWNRYRVECRGQSIKTFVNDILCADIKDAMTPGGIIGLQVHDVGNDETPYEVRWRNIRLMELK